MGLGPPAERYIEDELRGLHMSQHPTLEFFSPRSLPTRPRTRMPGESTEAGQIAPSIAARDFRWFWWRRHLLRCYRRDIGTPPQTALPDTAPRGRAGSAHRFGPPATASAKDELTGSESPPSTRSPPRTSGLRATQIPPSPSPTEPGTAHTYTLLCDTPEQLVPIGSN